MRKRISVSITIIITLFFLTGFVLHSDWFLLEGKDYSIQFPKKPETQTQNLGSAVGDLKMIINMYEGAKDNDENYLYGIITSVYPDSLVNSSKTEKLPAFFKGSIDGAVKNVQGKLLSEKEIEINGFPGREARIDFKNGMAVITMRIYLVHNQTFILQIITETSKEKNQSAQRFFESFKLK